MTQGAYAVVGRVFLRPVYGIRLFAGALLIVEQFLPRLRRNVALQEHLQEEIQHFFFALFFARDAYSLKWSRDVCEYWPTSIK